MRLNVTNEMMANLRFAYSPLVELSISYRILRADQTLAVYWRWVEEARNALMGLDLPFMTALITADMVPDRRGVYVRKAFIPDFLTPTPIRPITHIEEDFDRLRKTDIGIVRDYIQRMIKIFGENEIFEYFMVHPNEAMACLIAELREYWKRTLEHHWSRMMSVLENDVLHHSRVLTLNGTGALFPELHPTLSYEPGAVILDYNHAGKKFPEKPEKIRDLDGSSLYLVPVIFNGNHIFTQFEDPWEPMILYSSRGAGLWNYEAPEPNDALETTLGAGKARLLTALANPASTGELATKLSLTSGAVSQQLGKLHHAGLVESHRSGKHVFYRLSSRGEQLISLFFQ